MGNLDLRPEVANTLSATAGWHAASRQGWEVKVTPYYTRVQDYIDIPSGGGLALAGVLGYVRGENLDTRDNL